MKTKSIVVLLTMSCLLAWITTAQGSPTKRQDDRTNTCRILNQPDLWAGYKTFRKSCKNCHYRNNDKGATFIYAESKTMKAWNRVFTTLSPKCAQNGTWDNLTPNELLQLNDYLFVNAADAYDPNAAADCG